MPIVLQEGRSRLARVTETPIDVILAAQPFLAALPFWFILTGLPYLKAAWLVSLLPVGVRLLITHRFSRRTPFDVPVGVLVLGLGVGVLVSPERGVSIIAAESFLSCILIYYGLVNNSNRRWLYWQCAGLVYLLGALIITTSYFSVGRDTIIVSFNAWAFHFASHIPMLGASLTDFQAVDGALVPLIPLLLALTLYGRSLFHRITFGLALVLTLGLIILSASGRGWIAILAGISLVLFYYRPARIWWLIPLYSSGTLVFTVAYFKGLNWLQQLLPTRMLGGAFNYWRQVLSLMRWPRIAGLGLGTWPNAYQKAYGSTNLRIYNSYLELFTDMGIFGLVVMVIGVWVVVRLCFGIVVADQDSPWYGVAVGLAGGIAAGGVLALVEVTISTFQSGASLQYLALPMLWVWGALFVVSLDHLVPKHTLPNPG